MTKNELNIIKFVDEAVKVLSKNGVKEPFTIYIDESQYSKKVIDEMRKAHCYNVVLKFLKEGKISKSETIVK